MTDLSVVLKGFLGWLTERNGSLDYLIANEDSGEIQLLLATEEDYVVGVSLSNKKLVVAAGDPEDEEIHYRLEIGAKFRNPEELGIEIVKALMSFAQDSNRQEHLLFEKRLMDTAAELSLSIGSSLYSGFALMHLGIHHKDKLDNLLLALLLTTAAVDEMSRANNDELLAMASASCEQAWEAYEELTSGVVRMMDAMREDFLQKAPEADIKQLAELSGWFIRTFVPALNMKNFESEDGTIAYLECGNEGSDLITGGINQDFVWELMVMDYSEDGPYCRTPKIEIADSRNPDEVAFAFIVGMVTEGIQNLPNTRVSEIETRLRLEDIFVKPTLPLLQSTVLVSLLQILMGIGLKNLLEEIEFWDEIPSWMDTTALNDAINSFAESFPNSVLLDDIFSAASSAEIGFIPQR